jgi:hypothetical protein
VDHQQEHHEHHRKEREEKKEREHEREVHAENEPRALHPFWFWAIGVALTIIAMLIWISL